MNVDMVLNFVAGWTVARDAVTSDRGRQRARPPHPGSPQEQKVAPLHQHGIDRAGDENARVPSVSLCQPRL